MAKVFQDTKFTVKLTEQTIKELLLAIEKAKIFDYEVDNINVESEYSDVKFNISIETRPHTQESIGYKLGTIESVGYVREKERRNDPRLL